MDVFNLIKAFTFLLLAVHFNLPHRVVLVMPSNPSKHSLQSFSRTCYSSARTFAVSHKETDIGNETCSKKIGYKKASNWHFVSSPSDCGTVLIFGNVEKCQFYSRRGHKATIMGFFLFFSILIPDITTQLVFF